MAEIGQLETALKENRARDKVGKSCLLDYIKVEMALRDCNSRVRGRAQRSCKLLWEPHLLLEAERTSLSERFLLILLNRAIQDDEFRRQNGASQRP